MGLRHAVRHRASIFRYNEPLDDVQPEEGSCRSDCGDGYATACSRIPVGMITMASVTS
jgi:hypothetical protein